MFTPLSPRGEDFASLPQRHKLRNDHKRVASGRRFHLEVLRTDEIEYRGPASAFSVLRALLEGEGVALQVGRTRSDSGVDASIANLLAGAGPTFVATGYLSYADLAKRSGDRHRGDALGRDAARRAIRAFEDRMAGDAEVDLIVEDEAFSYYSEHALGDLSIDSVAASKLVMHRALPGAAVTQCGLRSVELSPYTHHWTPTLDTSLCDGCRGRVD
jgi:hypothetical protein